MEAAIHGTEHAPLDAFSQPCGTAAIRLSGVRAVARERKVRERRPLFGADDWTVECDWMQGFFGLVGKSEDTAMVEKSTGGSRDGG